jgi:hypothetical protein
MVDETQHDLEQGDRFPFDAPDAWWHSNKMPPPPPADWAHRAARGVLHNLADRHSIKRGLENVDEDVRAEIAETLAAIIRKAHDDTRS